MLRQLFFVSLMCAMAQSTFAQQWQRPTESNRDLLKAPFMPRLKDMGGGLTLLSTILGDCDARSCDPMVVTVTAPSGKYACEASIDKGLFRVLRTGSVNIQWVLPQVGACRREGQCKFDGPNGITVLDNAGNQLSTPVYTDTTFSLTDANDPTVKLPIMSYEPHVLWRDGSGTFQSCHPNDPKIINVN